MMDHRSASPEAINPRARRLHKAAARVGPEIGLGAIFLATALLAIASTRASEGLALLWPCNAIAAAVLIRLREVRWWRAVMALLVAGILANRLGGGDPWLVALGLSLVNLAEIAAMVYVFRVLAPFPYPDITIFQASYMTLVMGIAITGFAALLGSTMLHLLGDKPLWANIRNWWAADALGACVLAPPIILYSRGNLLRLVRPAHLRNNLLSVPLCVLVTYVAIRYVPFPFVIIALAPMMAAFQVGAFGTSILSALNCMTVIALWMLHVRPAGSPTEGGALDGLPFMALIATTMPPIAVGLGTDARRRVARTLRSSERRFRESLEHSPLGVILLDRSGKWTFTNTVLQEMLGYSRAELGSLSIESLAHPDEVGDVWQRWRQLLEGRADSYKITRRFRRSDGTWLWVHCAVSLARDDNGVPTHFVAQVESLEERRLAEARLANEREFLRTTLDSIGDAVITADAAGRITYMNDSAVALIGRPFASAEHRHLHEVLHLTQADTAAPAPDILERCRREKAFVKRDEPCGLQRPDGSTCYVSDMVTPVLDIGREISGFVVVLQDVTVSLQHTRELHHRADHDALTGLLNRAAFERSVHQAFMLAHRADTPASLLVVDLDKFKAVNDSAGHAAGDAVLRHVAAVMRRSVRPSDAVGRLGGDEFAVLLNDCDPARAGEVAARLRDALNPLLTSWEGVTHATGASMGMAHGSSEFADPDEWSRAADRACYQSKHRGNGSLEVRCLPDVGATAGGAGS
ncbi:MAG TPA: diguanylate cyclase [Steroidobacteraceae bacterium]|nr:diguanylate cyclase [Steroidobacteraceae bacterium]